jgi:hypothetical protein
MTVETKLPRQPKVVPPRTPRQEADYHLGMASFMRDRGFPGLASSHIIAAGEAMDIVVAL